MRPPQASSRSIQAPTAEEKARLDVYKVRLEQDHKDQLSMGRVFRLMLIEQNSTGLLRLPDGRHCHWRSVPRVASTSLNEIFQEHLAQFWRGASYVYAKPPWWRGVRSTEITIPLHPLVRRPLQHQQFQFVAANYSEGWLAKYHRYNLIVPAPFAPMPDAAVRFCVLRDPVSRFYSACERVTWSNSEHKIPPSVTAEPERLLGWLEERVAKHGRVPQPDPTDAAARQATEKIFHDQHLFPLCYFLGTDPAYYTHIFTLRDMPRLSELLSDMLGQTLTLPHANKTADTSKRSPALESRIKKLYADDYKYWGKHF